MNTPCPSWEYTDVPGHEQILNERYVELLIALRTGNIDEVEHSADTRHYHEVFFKGLTPPAFPFYAGHYRGEPFPCIYDYFVGIESDRRVGVPPYEVLDKMQLLEKCIRDLIHDFDNSSLSPRDLLLSLVEFACEVLILFFTIHPYANGNGHMGRFIVWALLNKYGYYPENWPIQPSPRSFGFPYTELIVQYRNGNKEPLVKYIFNNTQKNT